jgi:preprotein translocase subunit SecG
MTIFLTTLFIMICVLLIIVVLLQKGRGGGLGAAFSGGGSAAFGTRTGDVFTWVTIVLVGLFLLLSIVLTLVYRPSSPPAASQQQALPVPTRPATGEETGEPSATSETSPGLQPAPSSGTEGGEQSPPPSPEE